MRALDLLLYALSVSVAVDGINAKTKKKKTDGKEAKHLKELFKGGRFAYLGHGCATDTY